MFIKKTVNGFILNGFTVNGLSGFNGFVMVCQTTLHPFYPDNLLTASSEKDLGDLIEFVIHTFCLGGNFF